MGFLFPKDINSLFFKAPKVYKFKIAQSHKRINDETVDKFVKRILKFKALNTIKMLLLFGVNLSKQKLQILGVRGLIVAENLSKYFDKVVIYDPMSNESAKSFLSQKGVKNIRVSKNIYDSAKGSNGIVICTEWDEFKKINPIRISRMLEDGVIFDGMF